MVHINNPSLSPFPTPSATYTQSTDIVMAAAVNDPLILSPAPGESDLNR